MGSVSFWLTTRIDRSSYGGSCIDRERERAREREREAECVCVRVRAPAGVCVCVLCGIQLYIYIWAIALLGPPYFFAAKVPYQVMTTRMVITPRKIITTRTGYYHLHM